MEFAQLIDTRYFAAASANIKASGKRPILLDLDGTIIDAELLPLIGERCGIGRQLTVATQRAVRGEISFAESFRARVELLRHIPIPTIQAVVADAPINSELEAFIDDNRHRCVIVTGNCNVWIAPLVARFGVPVISSQCRYKDGQLFAVDKIVDKGEVAAHFGHDIVAVGDGHNDLPMLRAARFAVAYGGVHAPAPSLLTIATHAVFDGGALCRLLRQL